MSLPCPVSSPADATVMPLFSVPAQALLPCPMATPAGTGVTNARPPQPTPTKSKTAVQTPGPWLRREGWVTRGAGRERSWREGLSAEAAGEGEKQQRPAEGSGRRLRLCSEKQVPGHGA